MTDMVKGFTVILKEDCRIDDLQQLTSAVECLRGVYKVEPIITNSSDYITEMRVKRELREKLIILTDEL